MVTGEEFSTSNSDLITAEHVDMFWDKCQLGPHDGKSIQNTVFFDLNQGFGFRGNHESRQLCWGDVN